MLQRDPKQESVLDFTECDTGLPSNFTIILVIMPTYISTVSERTLGSYSNTTVRVTYRATHIGEFSHEIIIENKNDANNAEHLKVFIAQSLRLHRQ